MPQLKPSLHHAALLLATSFSAALLAAPHRAKAQSTTPKAAVEPGVVKGTVEDRNGKPMAGVFVAASVSMVQGDHFADGSLSTRTDTAGRYRIPVRNYLGVPHVSIEANAPYRGTTVPIPFRRLDATGRPYAGDTFDKEKGAIMNFTTAVSGLRSPDDDPKNWASYLGGCLIVDPALQNQAHDLPAGTKIRLVLTPSGPLLDGSAGEPVVREHSVDTTIFPFFYCSDIPLGVYTVEAFEISPDGKATPVGTTARIPVGFGRKVVPMSPTSPLYWTPNVVGSSRGIAKFAPVDFDIALP